MAILFSGDFHNGVRGELAYLIKDRLIKKYGRKSYDGISCHIILGDGGFLWPGQEQREASNLKALSERPFPVLCVCGNHEPVLGRTDLPEIDIGLGEKVTVVNEANPLVAYLKRGKVYHIDNRKCLVLGGALSVDKYERQPGVTWWKNEYWTEEEEAALFALLEKDHDFDCVLSHTGPNRINEEVFYFRPGIDGMKFRDKVAALNDRIDARITCRQWLCGHWHHTVHYRDEELNRSYRYLYGDTILMVGDTGLEFQEED